MHASLLLDFAGSIQTRCMVCAAQHEEAVWAGLMLWCMCVHPHAAACGSNSSTPPGTSAGLCNSCSSSSLSIAYDLITAQAKAYAVSLAYEGYSLSHHCQHD